MSPAESIDSVAAYMTARVGWKRMKAGLWMPAHAPSEGQSGRVEGEGCHQRSWEEMGVVAS
eukprot:4652005-Pleurochrysis_carterae.AAC.1